MEIENLNKEKIEDSIYVIRIIDKFVADSKLWNIYKKYKEYIEQKINILLKEE